jgi:hypothetical protein
MIAPIGAKGPFLKLRLWNLPSLGILRGKNKDANVHFM